MTENHNLRQSFASHRGFGFPQIGAEIRSAAQRADTWRRAFVDKSLEHFVVENQDIAPIGPPGNSPSSTLLFEAVRLQKGSGVSPITAFTCV